MSGLLFCSPEASLSNILGCSVSSVVLEKCVLVSRQGVGPLHALAAQQGSCGGRPVPSGCCCIAFRFDPHAADEDTLVLSARGHVALMIYASRRVAACHAIERGCCLGQPHGSPGLMRDVHRGGDAPCIRPGNGRQLKWRRSRLLRTQCCPCAIQALQQRVCAMRMHVQKQRGNGRALDACMPIIAGMVRESQPPAIRMAEHMTIVWSTALPCKAGAACEAIDILTPILVK